MTTDIAAVPLFWIVPLALYLLSFILVFARWPTVWTAKPHRIVVYAQPVILLLCGMFMFGGWGVPTWVVMLAHLLAFFTCVMLCHGELAKDRPSAKYLTEFYLCMSVGGVIGGMFNSLLAPLIFKHIIEYFVVLVVSLLLRPQTHFWAWARKKPEPPDDHSLQEYLLDLGYAACLGLLSFALLRLSLSRKIWGNGHTFYEWLWTYYVQNGMASVKAEYWSLWTELLVIEGIPLLICMCFAGRPLRLGLSIGAMMIANAYMLNDDSNIVYANRSFFSVQRVRYEENNYGKYHVLLHGGIDHGRQNLDPEKRDQPISYFYPTNPIGQIFSNLKRLDREETADGEPSKRPYAIVGLGIGTMASYGNKGQTVHFYEIDPAVLLLSEPTDGSEPFFWYLKDAKEKRKVDLHVILGDGRLKIKDAPLKGDLKYQVIVLDAFSSDAIPVHLMTKEAVQLYLSKLRDDGIIVFNITNRYVNLTPILADVAKEFDLVCLYQGDYYDKKVPEKFASDWVIMFPKKKQELKVAEALSMLQATPGPGGLANVPWANIARTPQFDWTDPLTTRLYLNKSEKERAGQWTIAIPSGHPVWTDHFSNLIRAMRW
jgi:spermidine synthase